MINTPSPGNYHPRSSAKSRQTRQQLRLAIITWIENTYHRRRRQHTLGRLTPIEFEMLQAAHPA
jgi:transposase InsO family protein